VPGLAGPSGGTRAVAAVTTAAAALLILALGTPAGRVLPATAGPAEPARAPGLHQAAPRTLPAGAAGWRLLAPPPGVPPPVDPARRPSAAAAAAQIPFDHSVPGRRQVRAPQVDPRRGCVADGDLPQPAVEPPPWGQSRLRYPQLRRFATGTGQVVAVIDTGVTPHPRLAGRLRDGGDYLQGQSALLDCDGHGTLVAGIIAASDDRGTGFTGIAPRAQILSIRQSSAVLRVRYLDEQLHREIEEPATGTTTSLALAVMRAVALGATVINISEAACFPASSDEAGGGADLQAAVHFAADSDVVVVAAAGNTGEQGGCRPANTPGRPPDTVASPAWFDEDVLTVGAIGADGEPAAFTLGGPWVDVAAPGTGIVSLRPVPGSGGLTSVTATPRGLEPIQGTSFAAPYVAGLAALVRQRFPRLSARQVMARIERTALPNAGLGGHLDAVGGGTIDPVAALTAVLPEEQGPQPPPARSRPLDGRWPRPRRNPLPARVAVAGSAAALLALATAGFAAYTVRRSRRGRRPAAR
jgi:membrane-anchored mycosin MYCP